MIYQVSQSELTPPKMALLPITPSYSALNRVLQFQLVLIVRYF